MSMLNYQRVPLLKNMKVSWDDKIPRCKFRCGPSTQKDTWAFAFTKISWRMNADEFDSLIHRRSSQLSFSNSNRTVSIGIPQQLRLASAKLTRLGTCLGVLDPVKDDKNNCDCDYEPLTIWESGKKSGNHWFLAPELSSLLGTPSQFFFSG